MSKDKAIEEIRAVRKKISEQYGYDTKALLKHYKELETKFQDRIISKKPLISLPDHKKTKLPNNRHA